MIINKEPYIKMITRMMQQGSHEEIKAILRELRSHTTFLLLLQTAVNEVMQEPIDWRPNAATK